MKFRRSYRWVTAVEIIVCRCRQKIPDNSPWVITTLLADVGTQALIAYSDGLNCNQTK